MQTNSTYNVIYMDPPWSYDMCASAGAAAVEYTTEETKSLVGWLPTKVATLAAKDCALFMWTTWPQLPDAMALGAALDGFKYCTCPFLWLKTRKLYDQNQGRLFEPRGAQHAITFPLGWHTAINTEFVLLWKKGSPGTFADKKMYQLHMEPIREHSRKPDAIRDMIVRAYPEGRRIELFARQRYEGWDAWGNETEKFKNGK